jgi:hypothetical protein
MVTALLPAIALAQTLGGINTNNGTAWKLLNWTASGSWQINTASGGSSGSIDPNTFNGKLFLQVSANGPLELSGLLQIGALLQWNLPTVPLPKSVYVRQEYWAGGMFLGSSDLSNTASVDDSIGSKSLSQAGTINVLAQDHRFAQYVPDSNGILTIPQQSLSSDVFQQGLGQTEIDLFAGFTPLVPPTVDIYPIDLTNNLQGIQNYQKGYNLAGQPVPVPNGRDSDGNLSLDTAVTWSYAANTWYWQPSVYNGASNPNNLTENAIVAGAQDYSQPQVLLSASNGSIYDNSKLQNVNFAATAGTALNQSTTITAMVGDGADEVAPIRTAKTKINWHYPLENAQLDQTKTNNLTVARDVVLTGANGGNPPAMEGGNSVFTGYIDEVGLGHRDDVTTLRNAKLICKILSEWPVDDPITEVLLKLLNFAVESIDIETNASFTMIEAFSNQDYDTFDQPPGPGENWTYYSMIPKLFIEYNENNWVGDGYGPSGYGGMTSVRTDTKQRVVPAGNFTRIFTPPPPPTGGGTSSGA